MRKVAVIVAMLMVLIAPLETRAAYFNGNKMMEFIQDRDSSKFSAGMIMGFVSGVFDSIPSDKINSVICFPPQLSLGQLTEVYVKFMRNNPELWSEPASLIAILSFGNAFPCPK